MYRTTSHTMQAINNHLPIITRQSGLSIAVAIDATALITESLSLSLGMGLLPVPDPWLLLMVAISQFFWLCSPAAMGLGLCRTLSSPVYLSYFCYSGTDL